MSNEVKRLKNRLQAISRSLFRRERIFVFEKLLPDENFKIEANVEVNVRQIQRDDLSKLPERFKAKAMKRLEIGHMGMIADLHGEIVHLTWVAFNEAYAGELERNLRINSDSAYLYDTYTVPKYRRLGISPKVTQVTSQQLLEMGIRKVCTCVRHTNFPMLRVKHKERFRKVGTITYTRIFKLRSYRCKGETDEDYKKLKKMLSP